MKVYLALIAVFILLTGAAYYSRKEDELSGKCDYIRTHCDGQDTAWDTEHNRKVILYACANGQTLAAVCEDMP